MMVVIGIPCFSGVDYRVLEDFMRFSYYLGRRYPEHNFSLAIKGKTAQHRARNAIVAEALKFNADYLLMLDDDMIIDFDQIVGRPSSRYEFLRTMISHDVPICGALYWQRGGDCPPVAMRRNGPLAYRVMDEAELTGGLQEVDVAGGGVILFKMSALLKIPQPWFEDETKDGYSTDVQICRKAQEAGLKVYLDSSIEIGHQQLERRVVHGGTRQAIKAEKDAMVMANAAT